jgi:flavin reductase (DIM6/NTAB) family NADH-FMN oxidoreductase RutF
MVSCSHGGKDNIITIAWTGIVNTDPPKTYISVRPSRHSYNMIKESGVFAINLTTRELVRSADWCGVYTGAKVDKFERCRLTKGEATEIDCVTIEESPLTLECRVTDIIPLGTHDMFLADIVAVDVDERLLDENGKLHLERAGLVAYAHGDYFELGKRIGGFGYSVAKKKKKPQNKKK